MKNISNIGKIQFAILIVGLSAYFGFYPLFETFQSGAIKELLAAIFGALMVSFITLFQLRQQTEIGDVKEKQTIVFEEKLNIFKEYMDTIQSVVNHLQLGEKIFREQHKKEDITNIIFILSKLRMHCEEKSIQRVGNDLLEIVRSGISDSDNDANYGKIIDLMFSTCETFRSELFPDKNDVINNSNYEIYDVQTSMKGISHLFSQHKSDTDIDQIDTDTDTDTENKPIINARKIYYANTGGRLWTDMKAYGFWQAGGTDRIVSGIRKMRIGDILCTYTSGIGYVGIGEIAGEMTSFDLFKISNKSNDEAVLLKAITTDSTSRQLEYCIPVHWLGKTLKLDKPVRYPGIFAAPMTSCLLKDESTLTFLSSNFEIDLKVKALSS